MSKKNGWKIEMEISTNVPGLPMLRVTQYHMNGNKRIDTVNNGSESRDYDLQSQYVTCTGDSAGTWECFDISDTVNRVVLDASGYVDNNPSKYSFVPDGSVQIAGISATCFKSDDVEGYGIRYCFAPDGAILYTKAGTQGTYAGNPIETEMKAVSYSTQVSGTDFVPPATPQKR